MTNEAQRSEASALTELLAPKREDTMKRLFALKEQSGVLFQAIPKAIGPLCFETRRDAKERRDEVNEFRQNDDKLCVTYGPDHDRFNER